MIIYIFLDCFILLGWLTVKRYRPFSSSKAFRKFVQIAFPRQSTPLHTSHKKIVTITLATKVTKKEPICSHFLKSRSLSVIQTGTALLRNQSPELISVRNC